MNVNKHSVEAESQGFLKIKRQRKFLKLTQQQVADIATIDIRLYQRLESGERQLNRTSFRIGVAIADILRIDVHELVHTPSVEKYLKDKDESHNISISMIEINNRDKWDDTLRDSFPLVDRINTYTFY